MPRAHKIHFVHTAPWPHGGPPYTSCGAEVHPRTLRGYYGLAITFDRTTTQPNAVTCGNCKKSLSLNPYAYTA